LLEKGMLRRHHHHHHHPNPNPHAFIHIHIYLNYHGMDGWMDGSWWWWWWQPLTHHSFFLSPCCLFLSKILPYHLHTHRRSVAFFFLLREIDRSINYIHTYIHTT
jgi:hypothetical protein